MSGFLARSYHLFHRYSTIYCPVYPELGAKRRIRFMFLSRFRNTFSSVLINFNSIMEHLYRRYNYLSVLRVISTVGSS